MTEDRNARSATIIVRKVYLAEVLQTARGLGERGDVKACLLFGLSVDLACAFDDGHRLQPWPVMPVVEPGHVVDNDDGTCLDAAVIAINGLVAADRRKPYRISIQVACHVLLHPIALGMGRGDCDRKQCGGIIERLMCDPHVDAAARLFPADGPYAGQDACAAI
jgi:hypothetical protein